MFITVVLTALSSGTIIMSVIFQFLSIVSFSFGVCVVFHKSFMFLVVFISLFFDSMLGIVTSLVGFWVF